MTVYQICVDGRLDEHWANWFDGLIVSTDCINGGRTITTLTGLVADQPALRGILNRIWDLNLNLISVIQVDESH